VAPTACGTPPLSTVAFPSRTAQPMIVSPLKLVPIASPSALMSLRVWSSPFIGTTWAMRPSSQMITRS
jgi:hypothetical protein